MENKNEYQAELFSNRLKKKYKEYRKWARKNRISCYRLYDRDIPEIPVSLDVYEFLPSSVTNPIECARFLTDQNQRIAANDPSVEKEIEERRYAVLYLYERPYEKPQEEEDKWLELMAQTASYVLGININHIVKKQRKQQKGTNQYEKQESANNDFTGLIQEQGQLFKVDLQSYLDTGLFFDHRPLRAIVRDSCSNKRVLNLFCYTGSFSVYAAAGNAKYVESLDLSNTYLNWAKENFDLNGFTDKKKYVFTKTDVIAWLYDKVKTVENIDDSQKFDIIILDPPTFSNSKSTNNVLDINKDWSKMVEQCIKLLTSKGKLYFSTNSTHLVFDAEKIPQKDLVEIKDLTNQSIPKDFEGTKCHKLWEIRMIKNPADIKGM